MGGAFHSPPPPEAKAWSSTFCHALPRSHSNLFCSAGPFYSTAAIFSLLRYLHPGLEQDRKEMPFLDL